VPVVGQSRSTPHYDWFLWKQSFPSGESRIEVRYLQRWPSEGGDLNVSYVLRTARFWGLGRIRRLRIELDDTGLGRRQRWKTNLPPSQRLEGGKRLIWELPSHRPRQDLVFQLGQRGED
jgi:hypothetical protein